MAVKIAAGALMYDRSEVIATFSGIVVSPTADAVQMAYTAPGVAPVGGDFKAATWETDATAVPSRYYARCLVGPAGTVTLTAGLYDRWVKITDSPEVPLIKAGQLEIY